MKKERESRLTVGTVTTDLLRAVKIGVNAGVKLVEQVASVRTSGLVGVGVADLAGVVGAGQTRALVGAEGVALAAVLVGVDAGIGLVAEAGVVGTAGVRVAAASQAGAGGVGAVATSETGTSGVGGAVAASQAGAGGVGAVAASQTRASGVGGVVAASQARAGGVGVGRAVLASTDTASASSVASSAVAVRVDTGVELVGKLGVVRTGGVAAVCSVRASQAGAGGVVSVTAVSQAGT